jgi:hypothetical protein
MRKSALMRAWFLIMMGLAVGLAAGCVTGCAVPGITTSNAAANAAATCGRTLTGVDIAVVVRIGRGSVSCPTAMTVEKSYAALIRAGGLRGNGGGAPVSIRGWTCQGYTSAEIAQTERVSVCVKGSAQIFTALPSAQSSTTTDTPPVPA